MLRYFSIPALFVLCASGFGQTRTTQERTFEFGFEQRVRNENWNNILDFSDQTDDEREQIRYRTRVWAQAPLASSVDAFFCLNQETNQKMGKMNRFDEVVVESAYLDFKRLFVKGLSLRVGRQNLIRGEGFLMLEGNSGDGSRSIYFNAFDLAYTRKKSKLELIGILDPKQDRFFPQIHDQKKFMQDWDEQALGLYYTDNNLRKTSIESYYFYKKEVRDYRSVSNAQFQPDRHISTLGGRVVRELPRGWSATGEFAGQWGMQHARTPDAGPAKIAGWGGYGYLKKTFPHPWKPYALAGYWGFSGDDPKTGNRIEGWDPIFSRWPKWSELYIYSQVKEVGVGYWTNLGMWQGEAGFFPRKPLGFRFTYYHMDSFHPFPGSPAMFGPGTSRGENLQAKMDLSVGTHWKGHVLYETQLPGNFYRSTPTGYFLRFEISYLVKANVGVEDFKRLRSAALGSHRNAD